MTEQDFREYVQRQVDETCGSAGALARRLKLHPKSLALFLSGARGPSAELAAAFGYQRLYAPIGPLSPTHTVSDMGVDAPQRGGEALREAAIEAVLRVRWGEQAQMIRDHGGFYLERAAEIADAVLSVALTADKPEDTQGLRETLERLEQAEMAYRAAHDLHGDGSRECGRAWDLMRRAGDRARSLLNKGNDDGK